MCEKEIESGFKEELGFFLNRGNAKVGFVHIFDWLNVKQHRLNRLGLCS